MRDSRGAILKTIARGRVTAALLAALVLSAAGCAGLGGDDPPMGRETDPASRARVESKLEDDDPFVVCNGSCRDTA